MKYTINFFLNEDKPDREGRVPLRYYVRVCGKKVLGTLSMVRVHPDDWSQPEQRVKERKGNPRAESFNKSIRVKREKIEDEIRDEFNKGKEITPALVKQILEGKSSDLIKYAEDFIELRKKKGKHESARHYNNTLDLLKELSATINFSEVTPAWLSRFEIFLVSKGKYKNNTIRKHLQRLATIFNAAIIDEVTNNYPFKKYKIPRYIQSLRTFLLPDEIQKVEGLIDKDLPDGIPVTVHYFLLGVYSGLRLSDWMRFKGNYDTFIQGDRFVLLAQKNDAIGGVRMHDKLKIIVGRLKDMPPAFGEKTSNKHLKLIAKIAGIKKHLTTHVARHTYATNSAILEMPDSVICHNMGISKRTLEIYKHLTSPFVDKHTQKWNEL